MTQTIGATGLQIGFVIACRTLVNALLHVPAGRVADRSNKLLLLLIGCLWLSGVIMMIPFMESFVMFLIIYCLLGLGEAIIWPVLRAYASIEGRTRYGHGTMMGVFSLAMSAGIMAGAMLAGFSMDVWGIDFAYFVTAGTVFIGAMGAVLMIGTGAKSESEPREMEQTDLRGAGSSLGTG